MKKAKLLALLLAMLLVLSAFSASVTADDHIEGTEEIIILPLSDLPEIIDREEAIARGHVARLRSEETDMHSVVFRNNDGTKSLYMFASPVKYESSDGTIRDKSTALTQTTLGYTMADNDVQVSFKINSSAGATMTYSGESVTLTPANAADSAGVFQDNAVIYNGVFGSNTMLFCTPLLSGMKSMILLRTQGTENSFSFNVDAGDLTASQGADGVIHLVNDDGEKIFKFGNYIVTDAAGKTIEGEMILTTAVNGCYTVTAEVDQDFLNSNDTVYPVIVEPTVTLNTSSAIDDTVIYSNRETRNYGSRNYHNIGYHGETYGIGRMLLKFPGLETNTTYLSLETGQLKSAEFCMYTASGGYTHSTSHYTHAYKLSGAAWNESTVTWNSFSDTVSDAEQLLEVSKIVTPRTGGTLTQLNLIGIMRIWLENPDYRQSGLLLRTQNETSNFPPRDFCSTEYADSHDGTYMPYLTFTYDTSNNNYMPIHLNILYDNAFALASSDPETGMAIDASTRISIIIAPVIELYKERFGIEINYTIQPTYSIYPETDACPNRLLYTQKCQCSSSCTNKSTYHHTNQYNIFSRIPNGDKNTGFTLLMTGRKTCLEDDITPNACSDRILLKGVAAEIDYTTGHYKIGIFNSYCDYSVSAPNNRAIQATIIHEIGHLYGINDHYDDNPDPVGSKEECLWGDFHNDSDIIEDFIMCEHCTNIIHTNYPKYNHE